MEGNRLRIFFSLNFLSKPIPHLRPLTVSGKQVELKQSFNLFFICKEKITYISCLLQSRMKSLRITSPATEIPPQMTLNVFAHLFVQWEIERPQYRLEAGSKVLMHSMYPECQ